MKTVVCIRPGELRAVNSGPPSPKQDQAILRIRRVGICGTDIHAFEGTQPYFTYPRILGHELAGELVDGDRSLGFEAGELFTVIPYWSCGNCIACRKGKPNCCVQMQVCGVHVDGGMTEYLPVPSQALLPGNGLTLDELALVEPLAIGAHSISRAGIESDEFVLVVGAGPIGLGIMQLCLLAGAKVIAMDVNEKRLTFCRERIGVNYTVNPLQENAIEVLRSITKHDMPTAVFDATGNRDAINGALAYLAHGGRYVLVGLQSGDICFSHPEFHKRETTLMSSRNALKQDFEYVMSCMRKKLFDPSVFITHRLQFTDLEDRFKTIMTSNDLVVKGMIDVGESGTSRETP
jgi:2-desacetyl-2-hydroxyethyl bacteriochlorophyllide A dehydrogenase